MGCNHEKFEAAVRSCKPVSSEHGTETLTSATRMFFNEDDFTVCDDFRENCDNLLIAIENEDAKASYKQS